MDGSQQQEMHQVKHMCNWWWTVEPQAGKMSPEKLSITEVGGDGWRGLLRTYLLSRCVRRLSLLWKMPGA